MEEKAKLFVNSPNTLEGNYTEKNDTSSAKFAAHQSGIADLIGDEDTLIAKLRELVTILPANNEDDLSYAECGDDLNRVCAGLENGAKDAGYVLSSISDNGFFYEVKAGYEKNMVTGFIRLNGNTVGAVANRSEILGEDGEAAESFDSALTADGCEKAARFVSFCDSFHIPILSLTNVKGYAATVNEEKKLAKAVAKLTYAFASATVPKVSVVMGEAFGSAYLTMNSKSIGADIVYAWPEASIGMMDADAAARIMYADEIKAADNANTLIADKAAEYAKLQSSAEAAARRGYVDDIIEAQDTRKYVIGAYEMLFTKREDRPDKKHGCV